LRRIEYSNNEALLNFLAFPFRYFGRFPSVVPPSGVLIDLLITKSLMPSFMLGDYARLLRFFTLCAWFCFPIFSFLVYHV